MKFLLFSFLISLPCFGEGLYSIKIPREVVEAMDLSDDLQRRLSGGDIIGNGGGIAEQDFRFAFRRVSTVIGACLESPFCPISDTEIALLSKIKKISETNSTNKDRLIFLSESEYPGFFRDSNDSQIRIAKTASLLGAPIFVNLDMLYGSGQSILSFPAIISVLVHELGHQAKVKSHSVLDELGTRLREFLLKDTSSIEQMVVTETLKVSYYNLQEANRFSEMMFHYKKELYSLKDELIRETTCDEEGAVAIGFKISNLHWTRRIDLTRGLFQVPLKAWLKIYCLDLSSSAIWVKDTDLKVELLFKSKQGSAFLESYRVLVGTMKQDFLDPLRPHYLFSQIPSHHENDNID